jgi:hypothetical protein
MLLLVTILGKNMVNSLWEDYLLIWNFKISSGGTELSVRVLHVVRHANTLE